MLPRNPRPEPRITLNPALQADNLNETVQRSLSIQTDSVSPVKPKECRTPAGFSHELSKVRLGGRRRCDVATQFSLRRTQAQRS